MSVYRNLLKNELVVPPVVRWFWTRKQNFDFLLRRFRCFQFVWKI